MSELGGPTAPADTRSTRGTAPASAPRPAAPGYYWVRLAEPRYVHVAGPDNQPSRSYATWKNPDLRVSLVELTENFTNWMGSDEANDLESPYRRLVEVIAKAEVPT